MKNSKKILVVLIAIVIIIGAMAAYYQFLYKSPEVDSGIAKQVYNFQAHSDIITAVRFMDNNTVISASVDSTIQVWNITGKVISQIRQPSGISSMDLSADKKFIVTGAYDGITRIIDTNKFMHALKGHTGTVWTVAISPDGMHLVSAGEDMMIMLWNMQTGTLVKSWKAHNRIIWSVRFSPDSRRIASAGFDNSFKVWDLNGTLLLHNMDHSQAIVDIAYSHKGDMLATASDDQTIRIWNASTGKQIRMMEVPEHIQAVAFSPDDQLLLTGGRDKTSAGELFQNFFGDSHVNKGVSVRLWKVDTGELLQTFSRHGNDVNDVSWSPDGKSMATASADHTIHIWELK